MCLHGSKVSIDAWCSLSGIRQMVHNVSELLLRKPFTSVMPRGGAAMMPSECVHMTIGSTFIIKACVTTTLTELVV